MGAIKWELLLLYSKWILKRSIYKRDVLSQNKFSIYALFINISETDDKKGNEPLVKSPSTETTSRFSFFWRNKNAAKTEDKAADDEGKKLREGKDLKSDKDLANYLLKVVKIRSNLESKSIARVPRYTQDDN